jgi:outer membrane lipoprotein SlyB
MRLSLIVLSIALSIFLFGCSTPQSPSTYGRGSLNQAFSVQYAVVTGVKALTIDRDLGGAGASSGALLGGVVGAQFGGGAKEQVAAGLAGVVIGGLLGNEIERQQSKVPVYEISLRLLDGQEMVVLQGQEQQFSPGERVRVVRNDQGEAFVSKL